MQYNSTIALLKIFGTHAKCRYLFSEDKCVGCGGIKTSASHQTKLKCGIKDAKDNKHGDESSRPSSPCDACTQTEKKKSNCLIM